METGQLITLEKDIEFKTFGGNTLKAKKEIRDLLHIMVQLD
ncbi:hypothetical protein [Clostridium sporogenes]|nr:hypothetical protein [Clostridium sporogenes]SQB31576.1 Uncharacterised protein [Clostridium sporogenes]